MVRSSLLILSLACTSYACSNEVPSVPNFEALPGAGTEAPQTRQDVAYGSPSKDAGKQQEPQKGKSKQAEPQSHDKDDDGYDVAQNKKQSSQKHRKKGKMREKEQESCPLEEGYEAPRSYGESEDACSCEAHIEETPN